MLKKQFIQRLGLIFRQVGGVKLCMLTLMCCLLASSVAFAQSSNSKNSSQSSSQKIVMYSGVVVDNEDLPLVGVNVVVKGSKPIIGTTTDIDGNFKISMPQGKFTLEFSYVGMKTQEVYVQNTNKLKVRLEEDATMLEQLVVTGIYRRNTESFTGSAVTYSSEKIKEAGNQNILQGLSLIDPSFSILENTLMGSDPNSLAEININGTISINGLTDTYESNPDQPLFILDGFETTLARISDMSMDRIESITILKDAASTAIYGAKAANGVIVVETKKPEAGKLRFSYNGNFQVGWADLSDYNMMNAAEKLQFEKLSGYYGQLDENGEILMDSQRQLYYSRLQNVAAGLDSYWLKEPLRTAFTHDHSINAEGGDSAFRYGITLRYKDTQGVMKGSDRENLDGSVNLSYRLNKFNFSNQTNIYHTKADNNTVPFSQFANANPYYAKRDENGEAYKVLEQYLSLSGTEYVYNPLWDYEQKSFSGSTQFTFNNNFNVEYSPVKNLRIVGKLGLTVNKDESAAFNSPYASMFSNTEQLKRGTYSQTNNKSTNLDGSLLVSYAGSIKKHTYNVIGGAQLTQNDSEMSGYMAQGYISDQFYNPNFSTGYPEGGKPSSTVSRSRLASFYINGNYSYADRYLFDINLRTDGASVYGVNNPFSTTWGFGVSWNIHNENWFDKSGVVNYLKIRYSLGNPGTNNINVKLANNVYNYYTDYVNMFGLSALISQWGNKNLEWQRTTQQNIGINLDMFKSRLHITADYTMKDTDPIVLTIDQPTSTGTSIIPMNIGATKNKSFSLTVRYDVLRRNDWRWTLSANMLNTKTKYDKIGNMLDKWNEEGRTNQTLVRYYDGASATALWAVRSAGIDPMTGNEVFIRKDGTYTYEWDNKEEVICGDLTPDIDGNISSTLRYKGWGLGMNFRYRWGGQIVLNTLLSKVENISETSLRYNQDARALHDRWQKPGDVAKFKRIDDTTPTQVSSRFIEDDNTFECKSVYVSYETTTAQWMKNLGLSSLNFRIYMNDIFRISTVKEERGLSYPFQRSISASIGLRF